MMITRHNIGKGDIMRTLIKDTIPIVHTDLFVNVKQQIKAGNNGTSIIVPHVCNNIDAFGAGFAGAVAEHYPIVKQNYHLLGLNFLKNNLGYVQFIDVDRDKSFGHRLIFANMISQNGIISKQNKRPLNYLALTKSMVSVGKYIQQNFNEENKVQIHAPKFGCGLAGGSWTVIQELIKDIWINIPVFIYTK